MSLRVTGVDTGMRGALVTITKTALVLRATLLNPGKRQDGWRTPSPPEVSRIYTQMRSHIEGSGSEAIVFEQVSATRGVAAARSLFICEGLLLDIAADLAIPIFGCQQQTLRAWVRQHLDIGKWKKGQGKQQILDAMPVWALQDARDYVVSVQGRCPDKRLDDLADAFLAARWGQETIQTEGQR